MMEGSKSTVPVVAKTANFLLGSVQLLLGRSLERRESISLRYRAPVSGAIKRQGRSMLQL